MERKRPGGVAKPLLLPQNVDKCNEEIDWKCKDCQKYFSTAQSKTGHEVLEARCPRCDGKNVEVFA